MRSTMKKLALGLASVTFVLAGADAALAGGKGGGNGGSGNRSGGSPNGGSVGQSFKSSSNGQGVQASSALNSQKGMQSFKANLGDKLQVSKPTTARPLFADGGKPQFKNLDHKVQSTQFAGKNFAKGEPNPNAPGGLKLPGGGYEKHGQMGQAYKNQKFDFCQKPYFCGSYNGYCGTGYCGSYSRYSCWNPCYASNCWSYGCNPYWYGCSSSYCGAPYWRTPCCTTCWYPSYPVCSYSYVTPICSYAVVEPAVIVTQTNQVQPVIKTWTAPAEAAPVQAAPAAAPLQRPSASLEVDMQNLTVSAAGRL